MMPLTPRTLFLAAALVAVLSVATYLLWRKLFRDGLGPTGHYDDEGGDAGSENSYLNMETFEKHPVQLRYFKISEFDSQDVPGSGVKMRVSTLQLLDKTRHMAGIPFHVNSGYRTRQHNASVGGVASSAHTRGFAADIRATTRDAQIAIVRAARAAGFTRFGIYDTFIHLDNDPAKAQNVAWNKRGRARRKGQSFVDFPFDPFTV